MQTDLLLEIDKDNTDWAAAAAAARADRAFANPGRAGHRFLSVRWASRGKKLGVADRCVPAAGFALLFVVMVVSDMFSTSFCSLCLPATCFQNPLFVVDFLAALDLSCFSSSARNAFQNRCQFSALS